MNIKSLRKNYDALSVRERLILLDSAEWRDDESEIQAIVAASKKESWRICDFVELKEKIKTLRLINLIERLKHIINTLFYLKLSENGKPEKVDFYYESACLEAYFYQVTVKVQAAIFEEIGIDNEKWLAKEKEVFDLEIIDSLTSSLLKSLAFTEEEAQEFIQESCKEYGYKNVILGFTVEKEVKRHKKTLKECGLAEMFKD